MQLNFATNLAAGGASTYSSSMSGTLITAIDQVPLVSTSGTIATANTWVNDNSNDTGVTFPFAAAASQLTPSYVRGIQNAREKELYKKHSISFYPAFYDYVVNNPVNIGTPASQNIDNGIYQRVIKKWVNCRTLETASSLNPNNGPVFYGPVYAVDINQDPSIQITALYDIRMSYSVSFKRLRGV